MKNTNKCTLSSLNTQQGIPLALPKGISVRIMTKDNLRMVLHWAEKEGWNPGKYEVEPLYQADPNGYRLLFINDEPIASLARVRYSANFAFLGLYIVKPEYRGRGYGKLLWDVTLDTLKDCNTIGLNGVMSQVGNYFKSEFKPATLNTRWEGRISKELLDKSLNHTTKSQIILTADTPLTKIIDYDTRIFSFPRAAFISKWLTMPKARALFAMDNDTLRGYGVISVVKDGYYKIAPLFADNEEIAERLYIALCQCVETNAFIHLNTNESNPSAAALAKRFGLERTFETQRMYKGQIPKMDDKKIFGLTSLEIG